MACFRSSSILAGMCKAIQSGLMNSQMRTFSGFTQYPVFASKQSLLKSALRVTRHGTHSIPTSVTSVQNVIALCPQILQSLTNGDLAAPLRINRGFHTGKSLRQNQHDENSDKKPTFGEQMSLRLINENGFLSWTRNSYLSAAVGATMLNGANLDMVQHAGILVLVVSAMNMAWGSACHFTNLIRIRDRCAMSRPTLFLNLLGCVLHALLWLFILGYYIRFSGHTGWVRHRRHQYQENAYPVPRKE